MKIHLCCCRHSTYPCQHAPYRCVHRAGPRSVRRSLQVRAAEQPKGGMSENRAGVLPGLNMWPPKPITEHGQPKPEDDPANLAPE